MSPTEVSAARGAVVVVAYEGAAHLPRALQSCRAHAPRVPVFVVDNASSDGSADIVSNSYPEVQLIREPVNRGFAGGSNVGIRAACAAGAEWVLLLNQDAAIEMGTIDRLAGFLVSTPGAAAVQPALLRQDGLVNSLGNPVHYLGFSVAGGNGLTVEAAERDPSLPWLRDRRWRTSGVAIPAFTGAVVMLRSAALRDVGLFEEELFLYHEDLELGLRLRRAGWTLHLLGAARAVHHYEFSRNPDKWYYLERNRHWTLFAHYSNRTLAALALPLAGVEAAVWALAIRQGWAAEKWRSYTYWVQPRARAHLMRRRRQHMDRGGVSDSELLAMASGRFVAAEAGGALSDRLMNPVSALLWRVLRPLLS